MGCASSSPQAEPVLPSPPAEPPADRGAGGAQAQRAMASMGTFTDEQVKAFFGDPAEMLTRVMERCSMSIEEILDGIPVGRKLLRGEPLAISVGCRAPDGAAYALDKRESTLHAQIKESMAQGSGALTVLFFGS